ncbi:hypothetical protein [Amphritea sp. HPY]|uniref:hypothetical protein n=1 Tax=Amphritea sp. HPY TaxID=3421652 RepID=UPI003D7E0276
MTAITFSVLFLSTLVSAIWLQRSSKGLAEQPRATVQAAALSCLFIALAALTETLFSQSTNDMQTLHRMLGNLAYYAALPMLVSALLVSALQQHWSRPAWGRWLIGLFALFELLRRMEQGELYTQTIAVLACATMLFAAVKIRQPLLRGIGVIATINMSLALLLFGPGTLVAELSNPSAYAVLLASAVPITAHVIRLNIQQPEH